jgi:type I restriction enzyme S subunit
MKKGWQTKTLGEICGFVRGPFGGSLKKSVFVADGFAVYEQQHAIYDQFDDVRYFIDDAKFQEMQRFELRPNDLIMSCSGTMGKVAIVPDNIRRGIINQALLKLTPTKVVSPEFLKYWMDSTDFQDSLKEQSGGAAIQNVASVGILKEIQISLPPLAEQQRIVGLLDEAFAGLATAKANAEKNLQNARALFESHLQSVFTHRGPGWMEKSFEDCIEDVKYTPKIQRKDFLTEGEFPIVSQEAEFTNGYWDNTADVFKVTKPVVIFGDHTQVLKFIDFDFVLGADGVKILPPKPFLDPKFFFYSLRSAPVKSLGYARHYRLLKELQIAYPDMAKQVAIAAKLNNLSEETQRLARLYERKLSALEALKKSLLHQAFSGEL